MALILTPRQLAQRAELYHHLGQLTAAGIGLPQALELQHRSPPAHSLRRPLSLLLQSLAQGATFSEALRRLGRWIPAFDTALLHAGEQSGKLPNCFQLLAKYYQERTQLTRHAITDLAYPLFLLHFAVFIGPLPTLVLTGDFSAYLRQVLSFLLPLYAAVFLVLYAAQGRHGETWRAFMEVLGRFVPLLGSARRDLALARLAMALEALLNAGVLVIEAWDLAAAASGSPALRRAVQKWRPQVEAGQTPGEALSRSGAFPHLFVHTYNTGEMSGQLDDALNQLHTIYQEEAARKLRAFASWTPKIIYLVIMLMIAARIVSFWMDHFAQLQNVM